MTDIDFQPTKQEIINLLRNMFYSLLGTTRGRMGADDMIPFVCAVLDPHAPMGCQFIYPHADKDDEAKFTEAVEALNNYVQEIQPYGTVVAKNEGDRVIFSLLAPGFAESYILPFTSTGKADTDGPYPTNMIEGLRFFRVS